MIFDILTVIKGLTKLSNYLAKIAHDKQLLDAGEYRAIARNNEKAISKINNAISARRNVKLDADSVLNDKNNRINN